jgi:hypothetical protein
MGRSAILEGIDIFLDCRDWDFMSGGAFS